MQVSNDPSTRVYLGTLDSTEEIKPDPDYTFTPMLSIQAAIDLAVTLDHNHKVPAYVCVGSTPESANEIFVNQSLVNYDAKVAEAFAGSIAEKALGIGE